MIDTNLCKYKKIKEVAERVGFEPTVRFPVRSLSRRVLSTAQSPLRGRGKSILARVVPSGNRPLRTNSELVAQLALRTARALASSRKEGLKNRGGLVPQNSGNSLNAMIEILACQQLEAGADSAALGIVRAIDQPRDTRLDYGACAHAAGLESDVQSRAAKPVISQHAGSLAKHDRLRVGRGIAVSNRAIAGPGNRLALMHQNGANGNFASFRRAARFLHRNLHKMQVVFHRGLRIAREAWPFETAGENSICGDPQLLDNRRREKQTNAVQEKYVSAPPIAVPEGCRSLAAVHAWSFQRL